MFRIAAAALFLIVGQNALAVAVNSAKFDSRSKEVVLELSYRGGR